MCFPTGETHITSDMCSGEHITRGKTYHCDTGAMLYAMSYEDSGAPNEKNIEKRLKCSFLLSHIVLWSLKRTFVRASTN